ncbi:MAG: hypothetical protein HRF46_15640 [Acidobacteriota bacterium]
MQTQDSDRGEGPAPLRLAVSSEIGRLRRVVVHRPGPEVDVMSPTLMHDHLFDDILYGRRARQEHDRFRAVLAAVADEVLDIQDLFAEALGNGEVRRRFVDELARLERLEEGVADHLRSLAAGELAAAVIGGLLHAPEHFARHPAADIVYRLPPTPNLLFMRDPGAVVNHGVIISSMATRSRQREPLVARTTFLHNPRLGVSDERVWFDELGDPTFADRPHLATLEGGDVLVLRSDLVVVGCSERTSQVAVEILAEWLRRGSGVETVLLVLMPRRRSAMHLDTVFTQISPHEALVYPPMFIPSLLELLPVVKKDLRGSAIRTEFKHSLLDALRDEGLDLDPIFCGGHGDRIAQTREQWTDGANAFCLAPGVICLYERNERTLEELDRHGYQVVSDEEVISGKAQLVLDGSRKTVVSIASNELSRARGGPRCMTMPIERDSPR